MSAHRLDSETLFLSMRAKDITYDPFCLFQVADYLPSDTYQALLESFPDQKWFVEQIEGDKHRLNSAYSPEVFQNFCRTHPLWREFFDFLGCGAFLNDLSALVRRGLFKSRGLVGLRHWCDGTKAGLLGAIVNQPVKMTFEFSRLERGSFVPPHTDDPKKLVSLMLYFPDPKWLEKYGGGTDFYRPKSPAIENNWDNRRVAFEDLISFESAPFAPNRLVVFLKSRNSYHAVRPITCPEGMARTSLNINVNCVVPTKLGISAISSPR